MKFLIPFKKCFCVTSENMITSPDGGSGNLFRVFTFNELKTATKGFRASNKIGEGGFGSVYQGQLKDGSIVAVKVLSVELESLRAEREFVSELAALSDIKHENLVRLLGCCVDGNKRLLVYEYLENNSIVHSFPGGGQNRVDFSWELRRKISLGVARALSYLHEEINPHIVHRDIKAGNILLDQNFTPKVSDFGLARLFRDDMSHISTRVAGTLGYLAPEYAVSGHLTRKSDVYSFGVLLLAIVTGRRVAHFDLELGEQFLVDKAWEMYKANNLVKLVDPVLNGKFPDEEAIIYLKVGLLCVQETAKLRPKMSKAIQMLMNEIDIEDIKVSNPGIVSDLMDVKIGHQHSSHGFSTG
ncbi:transmembrane signal receptor [Lithospermum erythrorhizon]|uniref:Transmembrane signal receptor n=1 Tax=Lithospermum erythrorhizon TaxID=34254 RepID=A0AAV3NYE4_LITER